METITFYSYKGGVGRTLALANIAIYLSRFGQNVCVVDFDLEAPGMHYKLPQFYDAPIEHGLVDYIYEFTSPTGSMPDTLEKFYLKAEKTNENYGDIYLMPAGNVLSAEYWKKLASIDWHSLFYKEGGEGIPFFLELKEKINTEIKPDFLLIDSRTGITEMSGLCTSLLADKVVFLITNNRENIEGSRQILRGIQKAERLKGQKPVEINFVLTRIPKPETDKGKEIEKKIIEDIQKYLNEETENLDEQLNISEISVLHSDRELELAEAVRLNQKVIKDTPLVKDYLKLFSKNIPEKLITSKLDSLIDSLLTPGNLLEKPDEIQDELEAVVFTYPHPKYIEKLIDFYILRNVGIDKILGLFCELWNLSKKFSDRLLSKFILLYLDKKYFWSSDSSILPEIAKEYLKRVKDNRIGVELKEEILGKILNNYNKINQYEEAADLYRKYRKIIAGKPSLKVEVLEALFKTKKAADIKDLLHNDENTKDLLRKGNIELFYHIMKIIGKANYANIILEKKLNEVLNEALYTGNSDELIELGKIYYRLNKTDKFNRTIPEDFSNKYHILNEIKEGYKYVY